jgi:hypothetical protein
VNTLQTAREADTLPSLASQPRDLKQKARLRKDPGLCFVLRPRNPASPMNRGVYDVPFQSVRCRCGSVTYVSAIFEPLPWHYTVMLITRIVPKKCSVIGDKQEIDIPQQKQFQHIVEIVGIIFGASPYHPIEQLHKVSQEHLPTRLFKEHHHS